MKTKTRSPEMKTWQQARIDQFRLNMVDPLSCIVTLLEIVIASAFSMAVLVGFMAVHPALEVSKTGSTAIAIEAMSAIGYMVCDFEMWALFIILGFVVTVFHRSGAFSCPPPKRPSE